MARISNLQALDIVTRLVNAHRESDRERQWVEGEDLAPALAIAVRALAATPGSDATLAEMRKKFEKSS